MAIKDFKNQGIRSKEIKISKQNNILVTEQLKKNDLLWIAIIITATLIFYFPTFNT